nr:glutathione s-transferase 1 [Quercus suber]
MLIHREHRTSMTSHASFVLKQKTCVVSRGGRILVRGEHKSSEFCKINPMSAVPAAIDGDLVLSESNAILQYAADVTEGGDKYYPKDLKRRAMVNRWLFWEASAWFLSLYPYLVENVIKPLKQDEPDRKVLEKGAPRFHQLAALLEDQLGKTQYLAGDLSIADIAVVSWLHVPEAMQLPLAEYPNIRRWYADICELPAWKSTQNAVDKGLLPGKN